MRSQRERTVAKADRRSARRVKRAATGARRVPSTALGRNVRHRAIWPFLITVVFVGVLFVAVFPTQTYLNQREQADTKARELQELELQNDELREQVERYRDPAHVELLAREQFGMVLPGEEAYSIVGIPTTTTTIATASSTAPLSTDEPATSSG